MPALPKFAGFSRACAAACLASDGLTVPVQQDMAGGHEVVCYVLIISGNIVQVALLVCHDLIHQASVTFNIKILNIYVKRFEDLFKFFGVFFCQNWYHTTHIQYTWSLVSPLVRGCQIQQEHLHRAATVSLPLVDYLCAECKMVTVIGFKLDFDEPYLSGRKNGNFSVSVQILLRFQPPPSVKGISYTDPCLGLGCHGVCMDHNEFIAAAHWEPATKVRLTS